MERVFAASQASSCGSFLHRDRTPWLANQLALATHRIPAHCAQLNASLDGSARRQQRRRNMKPVASLSQNQTASASVSLGDPATQTPAAATSPVTHAAAFFDVDGTILQSNVVTAFLTLKLAKMSPAEKALWIPFFAVNVLIYLVLDNIDRALFNRMFYRNYRGVPVSAKQEMAEYLHENYVLPRLMPDAVAQIRSLKEQGFRIVLVTGSLDFLMEPLAALLGCDAVYAARLKEEYGRFTGELEGEAVSSKEKADLVQRYANEHDLDLKKCHAYGDSIADLQMLEAVGHPHAVTPDSRLRRIAAERNWTVLPWSKGQAQGT